LWSRKLRGFNPCRGIDHHSFSKKIHKNTSITCIIEYILLFKAKAQKDESPETAMATRIEELKVGVSVNHPGLAIMVLVVTD